MARQRLYPTNAARQAAYRKRNPHSDRLTYDQNLCKDEYRRLRRELRCRLLEEMPAKLNGMMMDKYPELWNARRKMPASLISKLENTERRLEVRERMKKEREGVTGNRHAVKTPLQLEAQS